MCPILIFLSRKMESFLPSGTDLKVRCEKKSSTEHRAEQRQPLMMGRKVTVL